MAERTPPMAAGAAPASPAPLDILPQDKPPSHSSPPAVRASPGAAAATSELRFRSMAAGSPRVDPRPSPGPPQRTTCSRAARPLAVLRSGWEELLLQLQPFVQLSVTPAVPSESEQKGGAAP